MIDLENSFTYHEINADQAKVCDAIRQKGKELAALIQETIPESREQSIALRNVEESVMWANTGVARRWC